MTFDPYTELGLTPSATPEQIKAAYRAEAKACHPDAGGTTEAFQAVERAYRILKDPEKRARYDETSEAGDAADNIDAEALSVLASMIEHALGKDDLKHFDLVADMRKQLDKDITTASANVAEAQSFIDRALDARKRLKTKQPALLAMIDQKAEQARKAIDVITRQKTVRERAKELLADASFDFEPRATKPWGHYDIVRDLDEIAAMQSAFNAGVHAGNRR